jgi:putative tryptophan/tyrosine transport system substrate-binding protein
MIPNRQLQRGYDIPVTNPHAKTLVDLAAQAKLPAVYAVRHYVTAGGLMSYGPSIPEMVQRAADYVDQILKGEKPGDLPIQQPKTFDLFINNGTAKALGLKIPNSLLVQAKSVVE